MAREPSTTNPLGANIDNVLGQLIEVVNALIEVVPGALAAIPKIADLESRDPSTGEPIVGDTAESSVYKRLSLSPTALVGGAGLSKQIEVQPRDQRGNVMPMPPGMTPVWSSDTPSVAQVSQTGVVDIVGVGDALITARLGKLFATLPVTGLPSQVPPSPGPGPGPLPPPARVPTSIRVTPSSVTLRSPAPVGAGSVATGSAGETLSISPALYPLPDGRKVILTRVGCAQEITATVRTASGNILYNRTFAVSLGAANATCTLTGTNRESGRGVVSGAIVGECLLTVTDTVSGARRSVPVVVEAGSESTGTAGNDAALPRTTPDYGYVAPSAAARTVLCTNRAQLDAAIADLTYGDRVLLQQGVNYQANAALTIANIKPGVGRVHIEMQNADAILGLDGDRVLTAAEAASLPRITIGRDSVPALALATGSSDITFRGIAVAVVPHAGTYVDDAGHARYYPTYHLMEIGSANANSIASQPTNVRLSQCAFRGFVWAGGASPVPDLRRSIALHGRSVSVNGCRFLDSATSNQSDSQFIGGWNGSGPYYIGRCHMYGDATELIAFGGGVPSIVDMVAADVTVEFNYLARDPASIATEYAAPAEQWHTPRIKNFMETKATRRWLVQYNRMDSQPPGSDGQPGHCFVIKSASACPVNGCNPNMETSDVVIRYNLADRAVGGWQLTPFHPDVTLPIRRVVIRDLLLMRSRADEAAAGFFKMSSLARDPGFAPVRGAFYRFAFNTHWGALGAADNNLLAYLGNQPFDVVEDMVIEGNIARKKTYGFIGQGGTGQPATSLNLNFVRLTHRWNAWEAYSAAELGATFGPNNFYPANAAGVGFVGDPVTSAVPGDYKLAPASPLKGSAGGRDPGADVDTIVERTAFCPAP